MASIWSDDGKLATWLAVEQAATAAWAELGAVPEDAAARIAAATPPSAERVAEIEATLHHDTAAFVDAVGEQLDDEGRRWLHYGLTSSDLVDTALSTQIIQRDRHAELLTTLAVVASSLDAFALEIRHLARTEVAEVQEPFGKGQKGSSAMPHKKNPVVAERICGLARVVRANAIVGLENVALWHERDISHSSAERVVIPDGVLALDYMLDRFTWLVAGLVVRAERMRRNLESSHALFFSQRVLLALVESGLERDDAHRLVQRNAMRAWDEELDFRELVRADDEIAGSIDLDSVFDLGAYTRHVDTVFARLHALAAKEEPVHA